MFTKTKPEEGVPIEWGFYFYESIGKSLYETAFSPQELREKIKELPLLSLKFHQQRGDFARWIRKVFNNVHLAEALEQVDQRGDDLRPALLNALTSVANASCPRCGRESGPMKTWKMAGKPNKRGERLQLTIGHYKCPNCTKTYRKAIAKEKITA